MGPMLARELITNQTAFADRNRIAARERGAGGEGGGEEVSF